MGCDIHCYIDVEENQDYVSNFAKIRIGRNYWLFGLLAGVRVEPEHLGTKLLIAPRGLPEKNSYIVNSDNHLFVVENKEDEGPDEGCCERKSAESWVASGLSEWVGEDKKFVTNPDWHTHSYLYLEELKEIQEQYSNLEDTISQCENIRKGEPIPEGYRVAETRGNIVILLPTVPQKLGPHPELAATIATMEALNKGSKRSRLVFWFDN